MDISPENTVAQIVTQDISKADVFKKHNIDFCCGGGRSLREVCSKKDISVEDLIQELLAEKDKNTPKTDFNSWNLDFLIDYIVQVHHKYVLESIPILQQYSTKVARVHGAGHPEVVKVHELLNELLPELSNHLLKEEQVLFPYIQQLLNEDRDMKPAFGTIRNPISVMHQDHDEAGEILRRIRSLTNDYNPPEHACNTFKALYHKLEEFEADLHIHVHIENNILFPKATALEQQ